MPFSEGHTANKGSAQHPTIASSKEKKGVNQPQRCQPTARARLASAWTDGQEQAAEQQQR